MFVQSLHLKFVAFGCVQACDAKEGPLGTDASVALTRKVRVPTYPLTAIALFELTLQANVSMRPRCSIKSALAHSMHTLQ